MSLLSDHPLECLSYLGHRTQTSYLTDDVLSSLMKPWLAKVKRRPGLSSAFWLLKVWHRLSCPAFSWLLQISQTSPVLTTGAPWATAQCLAHGLQLPEPIGYVALGHLPLTEQAHWSSVRAPQAAQGETGQKKPSKSLMFPSWASANEVRPEGCLGTAGQLEMCGEKYR